MLIHDHFRVRRAAEPYSLQRAHRHDLRRHLTNTTLGGSSSGSSNNDDGAQEEEEEAQGCPTETVPMEAFIRAFDARQQQRARGGGGGVCWPTWEEVRRRIEAMLRECFALLASSASDEDDAMRGGSGLRPDPYGRALLGVDVLLDARRLEPHLIELNASPNVIGLVRERPRFFEEVFTAAFVKDGGSGSGSGGFRPLMT